MDRQDLFQEILELDVWDTHTHLVPTALSARSFWDIGHYFWFLRELQAAGYPQEPERLPEDRRIDAYLRAFDATRNTTMNWVVRRIFRDLYGIEITDAESIVVADQAVHRSARQPGWPRKVIDRLSIRRICVSTGVPK